VTNGNGNNKGAATKGFRKLDPKKLQKMFLVYQEKRSVSDVAKRCGVHRKTVNRYREELKWDIQVDKIDKRIQSKLNNRAVNRRVRNIKILDKAIENIEEQLDDGENMDIDKVDRLVRAQDLLIGRAGDIEEEDKEVSEELKTALAILTKLDEKTIQSIGSYIVDSAGAPKLEKAKFRSEQ